MRAIKHIKKHSRGGLIGGLIYLGLGAISLTSYFMEQRGIKVKLLRPGNEIESETLKTGDSQQKINIMQN